MTHYPVPEDFMAAIDAGLLLVGTAGEVAEGLRREIETAGVNYVLTRFAFGSLAFEEELRSATLFAREAMPRFAREPSLARCPARLTLVAHGMSMPSAHGATN